MILGGRSCPTPRRTASTSRNSSAAVFSSLVHDRRDRARRGPLTLVPLRSVWRLACGDRAAPGSLALIPPDGGTHALHMTAITQTNGRHRARAVPHPYSIGTVHRRRADGPCEDASSIRSRHSHRWGRQSADRQEGRGRACLCVVRLSHRSWCQGLRARLRLVLASVCHTALTPARAVCWRPSTQAIPPGTIRRE